MNIQKPIEWNREKNRWLLDHRGICFEDIVAAIESSSVLGIEKHPSPLHPNQYILIIKIRGYAYAVPFVENGEKIFLKTIYANRKYTNKYLLSNDT